MFDEYNAITEYCENNDKHVVIRNHAFCLYLETLNEALNNLDKRTPQVLENVSSALITRHAIQGYVSRAESFTDNITKATIEPLLKSRRSQDFWYGVASSVTGSFLFTLLLVIFFWLGKDQIRGWLNAIAS